MKIVLIRADMTSLEKSRARAYDVMPPLACGIIAALTPADIEVQLYDDRVEDVPLDVPADAVVLSIESHTARRGYELARRFRERGIPVIIGGMHPSFLPEEAAQHADSVAIGEAEGVWPQIIEDLKARRLKKFYRCERPVSLHDVRTRRDIFQGKRYLPLTPVEFGRGCRYSCDFCSVSAFYKGYRHRPVGQVVEELRRLPGDNIFFIDDNIAASLEASRALFKALIPLRISWIGQISLDRIVDSDLVDLMAQSGCRVLLVGLESLNRKNLECMAKTPNLRVPSYVEALEQLRKFRIRTYGTFVFGYDEDTANSFSEAVDFAVNHKFFIANFNMLMPYPGTPLYTRLKAEGRLIKDEWWLDANYRFGQAVFKPLGMSADELSVGCIQARRRFNSLASILYRAMEFRANCRNPAHFLEFMTYNLLIRREVYRKHGLALG